MSLRAASSIGASIVAFVFLGAFAIGAGCGQRVTLGGAAVGHDGGPPPDPCAGAPCGTTCAINEVACPVSGPDCPPSFMGFCDEQHTCSSTPPKCLYEPCIGKPCGAPCVMCDPASPDCPTPVPEPAPQPLTTCDANGFCVPGANACPPCDPTSPSPGCACAGQACGTWCSPCDPSLGTPCPPPDGTWICDGMSPACQPAGPDACALCAGMPCGTQCTKCDPLDPSCTPMFCDDLSQCVPAESVLCGGVDPCLGKSCGDPCQLCDPMQPCAPGPVFLECGASGSCTASQPACGTYAPCVGKTCGDPCTQCDPNDPGCVEPPGPKQCDPLAQCTASPVVCT